MAKKDTSQAAEKVAKAEKAAKAKKPGTGKGNIFSRMGKGIAKFAKDFKAEIKKIVWPDRTTVIKSTGVVLAVVAVIGVIIFIIDTGLTQAIQLLSKAAVNFRAEATTAIADVTTAIAETTTAVAETTTAIAESTTIV
ncbi:MAG TPA: preprotein translocase subunit SecE [Clostridia bacterium]|nr:preprotein translocase subunit SecE [Clostridia bacterium]